MHDSDEWWCTVAVNDLSSYAAAVVDTALMSRILCVLFYNYLHSSAPRCLQEVIQPFTEVTSRHWLQSLSSSALLVLATRRTTFGDRAFAIAGPHAWNTLPDFITDCSSSHTFKQYLRTYLFSLSFWTHNNTLFYDCVKRPSSSLCLLRRFKIVYFTLHFTFYDFLLPVVTKELFIIDH